MMFDDMDRAFAFVFIAITYVAGMVALAQGLAFAFGDAVADIDDNGISLRYPQDNEGGLTQDRPLFVNDEEVASYLEKFVEQLELIDFDLIHEDVK